MMRRELLTALPATVALPAAAISAEETPIMRLFRKWDATHAAGGRAMTDAECERLCGEMLLIERSIMSSPSVNQQDFIAKVVAATNWGDFGLDDFAPLWGEARRFLR